MKKYQVLDYASLLGMAGFSDTLLKNHFTLYQGYVNNTNKVMETLENMLKWLNNFFSVTGEVTSRCRDGIYGCSFSSGNCELGNPIHRPARAG